jgi:hypothetical protein
MAHLQMKGKNELSSKGYAQVHVWQDGRGVRSIKDSG